MKFMKKYKIHVCSRETNANCERTLVTPRQICYNEPIFEVTPHNESYGALRKFCALTSFRFHGNTASITAKLRIVSTQNLLANHSCSIMRYYLKFLCPEKGHREIPCGAGFEQSNPLLVTTSPARKTQYWHQQNEPEHAA